MGGAYGKRIGRALKLCRGLGQLSQEELAARVGLSSGAVIAAYEAGDKTPTLERAIEMALVLGVSLSQLTGEQLIAHLPHVTNNVVNGEGHTVYQHVEGGTALLLEAMQQTVRQVVQEELAAGRAVLLHELRGVLREVAREGDEEDGSQDTG